MHAWWVCILEHDLPLWSRTWPHSLACKNPTVELFSNPTVQILASLGLAWLNPKSRVAMQLYYMIEFYYLSGP